MTTAIAIVLRVLGALGKLPRWAWYVIGAVAGIALLWCLHVRAIDRAVAVERAASAAEAKHVRDSLTIELTTLRIAVKTAAAQTGAAWASRDSAVARTRLTERSLLRSQAQLATALVKLPDSLATIPAVDSVVRACTTLASDCERLRLEVAAERVAVDSARSAERRETLARVQLQAKSDSALSNASVIITAEQQKNAALRGRISKKTAVVWYLLVRGAEAGATRIARRNP